MTRFEAQFVDINCSALIQRVTSAMAIADELKSKDAIHYEKYAEIIAEQTNQGKMRKLFEALDAAGDRAKNDFYYALRNHEPYLLGDLGGYSWKHKLPDPDSKVYKSWSDMILKYKASVTDKCKFVIKFNLPSDELVELAGRYTEPVIIQKSKEQAEKYYHKWVRSVHTFGLKPSSHLLSNDKNHSIRIDQLFSPDSDGNTPKTVILSGDSGRGKSLTLQKIMLDWASGELYSENFDVIFLLKCEELKCISEEMSFNQLLSWSCSLTSHQISQILELTPKKILIIIDGTDEFSFDPRIQISSPTNPSQQALPMDILRSLLNGQILSESFLLVTTRSDAGTVMNLLKGPQRFTEIVGFSERRVQEYFQKFFQDEQLFRKTYESVKINESLLTACSVPLLCWMVCFCLKKHFADDDHVMRELKTTTSIYVHFVSTLLEHHDQSQSVLTMLRSLGQLAEEGMKKQQVFFDEKSVAKTGLDSATNVFLYKGSLKIKDKQEPVFRFMHFSFQEFFTALYYVLLDEEMSRWKISNLLHRVEMGDEIYRPSPERSNPFLSVMMFFCGLLNEEVSSSIFEKIKETVPYNMKLKKTLQESLLGMAKYHECERLFVLHCLYELQDEIIVREALKTHRFMDLSNISLRSTDCWVLLYCLQCCSHIIDLDLMYCDLTAKKLMILQPALCMCRNLSLSVENLLEAGDLIRSLGESKILSLLRVQEDEYSAESPRWSLNLLFCHGNVSLFLRSSEENPSFPAVLNISLTCPQSEISSTDWTLFFQRLSKTGKLADDSSALDEHVSSLLSSFHSVGLKMLDLKLVVLNESWASGIISLAQTYTRLQRLRVSVTGLLLEEGLMLLKKSLTDPHCTVIIEGRKCSKPTDQCKEQDWSHSCNENVVIRFKPKGLKKMRGTAIDVESAELQDFGFSETLFGFTSPPTTPPRTIRRSFSESAASPRQKPFLRLLVRAQGRRRDEQRAGTGNSLPGLRTLTEHSSTSSRQMILSQVMASTDATEPDDQTAIDVESAELQDFGFSETLFGFTSPPTSPPRTIRRSFSESAASPGQEPFRAQGRRRDEQRAGTGNSLPGLRTLPEHSSTSSRQMILSQVMASTDATEPDDQMNISDSEPSGPNLQPLPVCQSCVHIVDSDQWVQVEPLVCTDEGRSEFRISTLAGRFECSRTRMRWVCAGDVTLQYRAVDGCFLSEELERLQCERIGPVIDVTVISGKLEEAHLPHYACLAESDPSLRDAVKLLSVEEEGISLESVELTRFHAKILQPYFSPKTVLMKLGISVKVHCDLLIFMTHKNPIILHVYFFPIDSVFEEKIKTEKKSCHQISLSRPETPLQMLKQHSLEVPGASVQPEAIKLRGDIEPNFFQVKHPVVSDIKMSLSRVDDQKSVWTATIWKELINMHPNRAETLFQTGQNQNTPHLAVNFDKVQFFDSNWCDLIKSVENVNNIADKLLRKQIIHDELYSEITHPTSTSEASMRKICNIVRKGSDTVKEMFISILLEENPDHLNRLPLVDS